MKMKKIFWANLSEIRTNRKGFTLLELILTIALIGILLLGAVTVFMTSGNAFAAAQTRNRQQLLLDGMVEVISTELRYATEVEIKDSLPAGIYASGQELYVSSLDGAGSVLSGDGCDVTLEFSRVDDYTLSLDITLTDNRGTTTAETSAIRLINCKATENQLGGLGSGSALSYVIESLPEETE